MVRFARYNISGQSGKKSAQEATEWSEMSSSASANNAPDEDDFKPVFNNEEFSGPPNKRMKPKHRMYKPKGLADYTPPEESKTAAKAEDKESFNDSDKSFGNGNGFKLGQGAKKGQRSGSGLGSGLGLGNYHKLNEEEKKVFKTEMRRQKRVEERANAKKCHNCSEYGHLAADCPKLNEDDKGYDEVGGGICYKCGSTEHNAKKCKTKLKPGEYPFATCYTCKEQGHLAVQCPDNPRCLYPNGGCCEYCTSVEHFKKDCPDRPVKHGDAEKTVIHVGTLADVTSMDEEYVFKPRKAVQRKEPKYVKF